MQTLINISDDPNQELIIEIPDSSETARLALRYKANLQGWVMDLTYKSVVITNRRLCASPNLLRQWDKIMPFGLACYVLDGSEPYFVDDFKTGRVGLIVLKTSEVDNFGAYLTSLKDEA